MSFRHRLLFLPFCAVVGLAAAGEPLRLLPAQAKALGVETAPAGDATATHRGTLPATVRVPNAQLRVVSAPVGGLVEQLAVAPGDAVRRGQPIARLSSAQGLELWRDARQAESRARLQAQNLVRDERLFAEGLIAEARLQASRAEAEQATAQASERRQGLALAGIAPGGSGGMLVLTAPIDGVVLEQGAQVGRRVDPADLIYRIGRLQPLWLDVQAPVGLAATLRAGMPVRVAGSGATGELLAIGRAVDAASQTVLLRVQVSDGAGALRPGQAVEVEIAAAGGLPRVPAAALVRSRGAPLVFVQQAADGDALVFSPRPVRIVSEGGDGAVIDGVGAGERIAVKGVSGLKAMLAGDE